jgi:hypothetical protein
MAAARRLPGFKGNVRDIGLIHDWRETGIEVTSAGRWGMMT